MGRFLLAMVGWMVVGLYGVAQKVPVDRYSSEPAVIERNDREVVVAADGTGSEQQQLVVRVQTEAAVKELSVVSFAFASASQRVDLDYVRVRHPDGTVVDTPLADALEMPTEVMRQAPFYSDLKQKQIPVRGLRTGDRLEWSVRLVRTAAEAPGRFWGVSSFTGKERVALAESFTLRMPEGTAATVWSPKLPPKIAVEGKERVYRWTSSQMQPTVGAEATARAEAEKGKVYTPEETTDWLEGTLPTIAWTNFPDWAAVGGWYRGLEGDRAVPDAGLKAKVAALVAGKTTDEAKIRALYGYVATEIRYIGVALGQGRYQPHMASEVLVNQYGDCKDKATLLAAMLAAAGYPADTVLIGAGIRLNEAVPSPASFNHAITAVRVGTEVIWLDATQEVAPYRALLLVERDRRVLRVPLDGPASLDRTPAQLPFSSFQRFESEATLDAAGTAKGRITVTLRGDEEIAVRTAVRQISAAQYDQAGEFLLRSMGFAGKVSHVTFTSPDRTGEPFAMTLDYLREKPGDDWGNYRVITLEAHDGLPGVDEKEPPRVPLELGSPRTMTTLSRLALPPKWGAAAPEAIHEQTPWVRFDRTYRVEKGVLIEEKTLTVLQARVPASEWKGYKRFADATGLGTYPYVQLTRERAETGAAPGPPAATKDDPEAARLIQEAGRALQSHDLALAAKLTDQAKAINDEQPYLWSALGAQAMLHGETTAAAADFGREVSLHPSEGPAYQALAVAQLAQGRREDAEATLERRLKAAGPDDATSKQLAQLKLDEERPDEALRVVKSALDAKPDDVRMQWMLGRTQMKAGKREAGIATLLAALDATEEPGLRNDIAYELADGDHATAGVEAASRSAVESLTAETTAWKLTDADQDIGEMRRRSSLLVASWDTLGWTIYKSATGKEPARVAEARKYLEAAWRNGYHTEVGLHLGEVEESQHEAGVALGVYQLAEQAAPHTDIRGVRQAPSAVQRELRARIERLSKAEPGRVLKEPGEVLRDEMKLKAGASGGQSIVMPYRMLLTSEGVVSVVPAAISGGDHGRPDPGRDLGKLRRTIPKEWVPEGSKARLLRSALLNCH